VVSVISYWVGELDTKNTVEYYLAQSKKVASGDIIIFIIIIAVAIER
jgi:hypothetical protein